MALLFRPSVTRAPVAVALGLLVLATAPRALAAQSAAAAEPEVTAFSRLRLHIAGQSAAVIGTLIVARSDTIVVQTGEWRAGGLPPSQFSIPTRLLQRAEVQVGTVPAATTAWKYGAVGAAAAALLGAAVEVAFRRATRLKDETASPFGDHPTLPRALRTAAIAGLAGGTIGATVGSLTPRPLWRAVTLPLPGGPSMPR